MYSEKQKEVLQKWRENKLARINILEGSVRSGKTWISLVLWAFFTATMPKNGIYLMAAKTLGTLRRNVLEMLQNLVGTDNFTYSLSKKEGELFGRKIFFEGAGDIRSENKIRGLTLTGAYCDELTLFNEEFFAMLLSRLSASGAKLIGTTNPDSPSHWLKTKYIDRKDKIDLLSVRFLIEDNIFLDKDYVKNLKSEYTGVFYDRYIRGMWKAAEGTVYPQFADNPADFITENFNEEDIAFAAVGVDFGGNKSAHAFVCTGFTKYMEKIVVLKEFYLKEKITPAALEECFVKFVKECSEKYRVYDIYCDCAETTLVKGFENAVLKYGIAADVRMSLKKPIINRIRFVNAMMSKGRFLVLKECQNTISALQESLWDEKSLDDKRLDNGVLNIDSLDAMEYSIEPYMEDFADL